MTTRELRNLQNLNKLPDLINWFESDTLVVTLESNVAVIRLLADGSFSPSAVTFTAYRDDTNNNRVAYPGRFIVATSIDGVTYTDQYTSGSDEPSVTFNVPIGATFVRGRVYKSGGTTSLLAQQTASVVRDGIDGSSGSGTDAVVVNLSKSSAAVFAYADGTVPDFTDIDGQVTVFEGTANETASASFAVTGSGLSGTINTANNDPVSGKPKGYYRVTAMSADIGSLVITTTYNGVDYVRSFSVSKIKTGFEIVGSLPVTNLFEGRMVFLTTDDKLYRYTGTAWTTAVPATDITGTIVAAQIADAALTTAKFASSIEPVTLVSSVPGTKSTNSIFNTTDGFLYRWNGSAYVKTVPTTDLSGTVTNAQIDAVAATKVTGTLTNSQIADLAASKITGTITETQIANDAITTAKIAAGAISTAKLAANAVTANELAANAVTAVKISAGAVETAKLAAGAVTANEIAANTITAGQIAAGAINTDELAANAVTTAKLAAGAVTANEIAANTITAAKIAAGTITATELATNAVTADKINAGAVTAAKITVTSLAAMTANTGNLSVTGTLTLGTNGKLITSGTAYNGNGIFLGEDGAGVYKFSVGGASGKLAFDGTDLSIPGGLIVGGTVATAAIANNAVTIGYSEETDGNLAVTDAWQDAETISVTVAAGQEVDIHWSLACSLTATAFTTVGGALLVKLLRDSTEIYSETEIAAVPAGAQSINLDTGGGSQLADIYQQRVFRTICSGMDFDAPSAGTYTYKLQVKHNTGDDASIGVTKRRLKAVLRKK
jgi:hypothetical protein